jgi:hypothetical protein
MLAVFNTRELPQRAMRWACSTKLSGNAEPSTPLGEFDHRHEAVAACEQHYRTIEKHRDWFSIS